MSDFPRSRLVTGRLAPSSTAGTASCRKAECRDRESEAGVRFPSAIVGTILALALSGVGVDQGRESHAAAPRLFEEDFESGIDRWRILGR